METLLYRQASQPASRCVSVAHRLSLPLTIYMLIKLWLTFEYNQASGWKWRPEFRIKSSKGNFVLKNIWQT